MKTHFVLVLVALVGVFLVEDVKGQDSEAYPCPHFCSGHGLCSGSNCECFDGWMGGDCSLRTCPYGTAWNDNAVGVDDAHGLAECSNRGRCDRVTGTCICDVLFTGLACQESKCPNDCWGRGRCIDMRYNAKYKDPGLGTIYTYESVWDAEKIYGCKCDQGFHGYDCSLRDCPVGDDPLTTGQVDEVQLVKCSAENGFFTLQFRGFTTEPIPFDTQLIDFEAILEATPGFGDLSITFSEVGVQVCSASVSQVVSITFLENFGDLESLVVPSTHTGDCYAADASNFDLCGGTGVTIATKGDSLFPSTPVGGQLFSVTGTKENKFCSNRGTCDKTTGICTCYTNFVTSNGRAAEGDRGDCGYPSAEIQACPGLISCSGHGVCSQAPEYKCTCSAGWTSGDCSQRTCPLGKSWFDIPIADNRAHQLQECSNMGICDQTTGECRCLNGYEGASCDKMACPGSPTACSGHGQCLSMAQLADKATVNKDSAATTYGNVPNNPYTWDYDMVFGCLCDEGFEGHDCSQVMCPYGDNPDTGYEVMDAQHHEKVLLRCTGDGGSIRLYFRMQYTEVIAYDASTTALRNALTALSTITDVDITYSSGSTLCTSGGTNVVSITFTQELGDLPALVGFYQSEGAALTHSSGTPLLEIATDGATLGALTSVRGSRENLECSGKGICNKDTGVCSCFTGYGSSNGNMQAGDRGDCGWRVPWAASSSD